jgi:hypothetical protein
VAELADAQDLGFGTHSAQPLVKPTTYENSPECLGGLLGAFAAKITPLAPDLAKVLTAWPKLPDNLKAAVLAIVRAGQGENERAAT